MPRRPNVDKPEKNFTDGAVTDLAEVVALLRRIEFLLVVFAHVLPDHLYKKWEKVRNDLRNNSLAAGGDL